MYTQKTCMKISTKCVLYPHFRKGHTCLEATCFEMSKDILCRYLQPSPDHSHYKYSWPKCFILWYHFKSSTWIFHLPKGLFLNLNHEIIRSIHCLTLIIEKESISAVSLYCCNSSQCLKSTMLITGEHKTSMWLKILCNCYLEETEAKLEDDMNWI